MEEIAENIKTVLVKKIKSLKWLDDSTKIKALDKAKSINILTAFPNWMTNESFILEYYRDVSNNASTVSQGHMFQVRQ